VQSIKEKPPAHTIQTNYINAGVYGFGESIFDDLRETDTEGELAITTVLQGYQDALRAIPFDGLWLDVSYHWDILSVNSRMLDRLDENQANADSAHSGRATIHERTTVVDGTVLGSDVRVRPGASVLPGTSLGDNVEVGSNAVVSNSVVLTDATIGDGAVVRDCVVGENATVGPNTTIEGGETDVVVDSSVHTDVRLGGVIGDNARLGGNVTVSPGTVIGNHSSVESGAVVADWIETNAVVRRG
jgi:glucose-1-phosphate thymidylyltransferase